MTSLNHFCSRALLLALPLLLLAPTARAQSTALTCAKYMFGSELRPAPGGLYVYGGMYRDMSYSSFDDHTYVSKEPLLLVATAKGMTFSNWLYAQSGINWLTSPLFPAPAYEFKVRSTDRESRIVEWAASPITPTWWQRAFRQPGPMPYLYVEPGQSVGQMTESEIEQAREKFQEAFASVIADHLSAITEIPDVKWDHAVNAEVRRKMKVALDGFPGYPSWLNDEQGRILKLQDELEKVYAGGYIVKSDYEARASKLKAEIQAVHTKIDYAVSKGIKFIFPPRLSDEKIKRGEEFMMACAPFMISTNQGLLKFRANAYGVINDKYFTEKGEFEKAIDDLGGPEKFGLPVTAKK